MYDCISVYRICPYFRGTQIPWLTSFLQNTNFHDNNFRDCVTSCFESACLLDFQSNIFRDLLVHHGNHEVYWPRIFGAIRYIIFYRWYGYWNDCGTCTTTSAVCNWTTHCSKGGLDTIRVWASIRRNYKNIFYNNVLICS